MSLNTSIIFCDSCGSAASSHPQTTYSLTSCGGVACPNCLPNITASCSKCRPCTHIAIDKKMRSEAKLYFTNIPELQKTFNSAVNYQLNRYKLLQKQQNKANEILLQKIDHLRKENRQQKRLMAQQLAKSKQQQPRHEVEFQQNYHHNNNHHGRSNESIASMGSHITGVSKRRPKYHGGFPIPNFDMQPQQPSRAKSVVSRKSFYTPPVSTRNQLPIQMQPPSPNITYQSIPIHYQASQHPAPYLGPSDHYNLPNYAPSVVSRSRKSGRSTKKISNIQIFQ